MAKRDFWDEIMVNTWDIDLNAPSLNDMVEEFENRVKRDMCFLKLLCNHNKLNFSRGMSCGQLINRILQKNREFIIDLLALIRFKYRKRYDIIEEICEKCLDDATQNKCTSTGSKKTGKYSHYALLLSLLIQKKDESFKDIFYKDFSANKGFNYYEISSDELPTTTIAIDNQTPAQIDSVFLDDFEKIRNEKKESHCWYILKEGSQTEIFIRRDTTEGYIPQVHRNFRTKFSEYIIMKFLGKGEFLELHSTHLKPPESIANHFATKIFGEDYRYRPVEGKVSMNIAQEFIKAISTAADTNFIFFYVRAHNVNLPTLPRLVVENTKGGSIVTDIDTLKNGGIDLLRSVEDIEKIELIFKETKIPLSIRVDKNNRVEFLYQYNRLDDETRRTFTDHMREKYDIPVIPSK